MASQTPPASREAPPEAQPSGAATWRRPFARRALSAARVRSLAALDRLALRRKAARVAVMPTVRYRDVPAAIAWLCAAFGMEVHRVVAGESGAPCYAELRFGGNLLMIAPIEDTAFGRLMVQPDEIGGVETRICYLHVEDAAVHYARAKAAGAEIVLDIEDEANSGRGYSCRDPEGHVWNFGTYDPWQKPCTGSDGAGRHRRRERNGLAALVLLLLAVLLASDPVPRSRAPGRARPWRRRSRGARGHRAAQARSRGAGRQGRRASGRRRCTARRSRPPRRQPRRRAPSSPRRAPRSRRRSARPPPRARASRRAERQAGCGRSGREAQASLAAAEKDAKDARTHAALERSKRVAAEHAAARTRKRVASFRVTRPPGTRGPGATIRTCQRAPSHRAQRLSGFCKS